MKIKYRGLPVLLLAAIASLCQSATAGTLACDGTVEHVAMHANGRFMVQLSSMNYPVFFCSPDYEWTVSGSGYKTSTETCKMLYATFLAARTSKQPLTKLHFDGDDVPASCGEWASWKSAHIRFVYF